MQRRAASRHTAGMQIYLVEDSATVRDRLIAMLDAIPNARVVGYAASAEAAIAGILERQPDLVVLDMHLAAGSGFDVLRAVRPQAPGIEFYMLSNFAADPYRQLAARLGATGFYDKSKQFDLVRDAVARRAAAETNVTGRAS
jgi:DNA-binding NarL/FixJ family response regulator